MANNYYNPYNPYDNIYNPTSNYPYTPNYTRPNYNTPQMNQPMNNMQVQQPQQDSNVQWIYVSGIEGARNCMLNRPNQTVYMMSQNANEFYVKATDNLGVATLRCYRFSEFDPSTENAQSNNIQTQNFVSRDEFNQFVNNVSNQFATIQQQNMVPVQPVQQVVQQPIQQPIEQPVQAVQQPVNNKSNNSKKTSKESNND